MKIGIKLRCYPDSQLKQLIHQTAGNNRFIYNYFLNLKNTIYQEKKLPASGGEVKTVEKCKTKIIPMNNSSNFSEAVIASL